jgi:aminoglycoside phosphotransferase family enzyme/predicted kinase
MEDEQREVVAFLRDPASYRFGAAPAEVPAELEVIETHASIVCLAGAYAYKLKRAVKYAYLDFSTLALRLAACGAELRLNRRTAPQLYLEVRAISRGADGSLRWGREGRPDDAVVDYVVVMRRFEQRDLLDNLARRGALSPLLLYALTAHIAAFHGRAEKRPERGGAAIMAGLVATNIGVLRRCRGAGFEPEQIDRVEAALDRAVARVGVLLDQRRDSGKVRLGHGDLHLGNICIVDGKPLLFDGIEFSEDIASIDVLYDLAFLLMDLDHRGHREFANLVLNRYLDLTGEDAGETNGLAAMPLFLALRAVIRAHVTATRAERGWGGEDQAAAFAEARAYLDEAEGALTSSAPRLIAIGGLSGTGKSTLAAALAPALGPPPGARVLRSDVIRKLLFGSDPETPLPPEAYAVEMTERVYHDLRTGAAAAVRAGYAAVIDAVALREDERRAFAAVAADAGMPFTGLWLEAPADKLMARVQARSGDASDASPAVIATQLERDPGAIDWRCINAGAGPAATLAAARRALVH